MLKFSQHFMLRERLYVELNQIGTLDFRGFQKYLPKLIYSNCWTFKPLQLEVDLNMSNCGNNYLCYSNFKDSNSLSYRGFTNETWVTEGAKGKNLKLDFSNLLKNLNISNVLKPPLDSSWGSTCTTYSTLINIFQTIRANFVKWYLLYTASRGPTAYNT